MLAVRIAGGLLAVFFWGCALLLVVDNSFRVGSLLFGKTAKGTIVLSSHWVQDAAVSKIRLSGGTNPAYASVYTGSFGGGVISVVSREGLSSSRDAFGIRNPGYDVRVGEAVGAGAKAYDGTNSLWGYYLWRVIAGAILFMLSSAIVFGCVKGR